MALQFSITLDPQTNEPQLVFLMGESRESLQEQTFESFIDGIIESGRAVNVSKNTANGVVTTKFVYATGNGNIDNPAIIGDAFLMFNWLGNTLNTSVRFDNGTTDASQIEGITTVNQSNLFKQIENNRFLYQGSEQKQFKVTGTIKANDSQTSPFLEVQPYLYNEATEVNESIGVLQNVPDDTGGFALIALDGIVTLSPGDTLYIGFLHENASTTSARRITVIEGTVFITQID